MKIGELAARTGLTLSARHAFAAASACGHLSERGSSGDTPPFGLTSCCAYPFAAKM